MIASSAPTFITLLVLLMTHAYWSFSPHLVSTRIVTKKDLVPALSLATGKGFAASHTSTQPPKKQYPPLSQQEIEQWMSHIPVYAVTDTDGNGQAIQVGKKTVLYFFFSPILAEAFLKQLPSTGLIVSGLFLGKIWSQFNFLPNTKNKEEDDEEDNEEDDVQYRLVADPRDLTTAQALLQMQYGEEEPDKIRPLKPFDEIPLFGVNNMPLTNQSPKVKDFLDAMVSSHYMFFSSRNMLDVMEEMNKNDDNDETDSEEDQLIFLHQVLNNMQQQPSCTTDYRNIMLMPSSPILDGTVSDAILAKQLEDPNSFVSQTFLLPLLKE